jgi:hypothetical protein
MRPGDGRQLVQTIAKSGRTYPAAIAMRRPGQILRFICARFTFGGIVARYSRLFRFHTLDFGEMRNYGSLE